MQKIYHWFLLLVLLWSACSKSELPPDVPGDPVFTAQYQVAGQEYALNAGVDSQYLFTNYRTDNVGVLVLSGSFAAVDCSEALCPGNLTFEFRNDRLGNVVSPDTTFFIGDRAYYQPVAITGDTIWRTTFTTPDSLDYQSFQWIFDNAALVPGKTVVRNFTNNSEHTISLLGYKNGAIKSVVNRSIFPVGSSLDFPVVNITVTEDTVQGYTLTANATGTGSPVTAYHWSTGASTPFIMVDSTNIAYEVHVVNQNSDSASARIITIDSFNLPYKTADFTYQTEIIAPPTDLFQLGSVQIRWIDEAGGIWISGRGNQTPDAYFQVIASEPYELNENGEKTRKMTVSFSCKVFNNTGQSLPVTGTAVIAVAYP